MSGVKSIPATEGYNELVDIKRPTKARCRSRGRALEFSGSAVNLRSLLPLRLEDDWTARLEAAAFSS